ncbi:MAG: hypothetical protein ACREMM_02040 [Gemmatimonadales bacterium]
MESAVTLFEDQARAVEEWLAEEFPQALAIESDPGLPTLAKFTVTIDLRLRYLLAIAAEFFDDNATPAVIVSKMETRFVARELRDHPDTWLLVHRVGPPVLLNIQREHG